MGVGEASFLGLLVSIVITLILSECCVMATTPNYKEVSKDNEECEDADDNEDGTDNEDDDNLS